MSEPSGSVQHLFTSVDETTADTHTISPDPVWRSTHLTSLNLRKNEPFGDVMTQKEDGTFRIWGQNFNGLHIDESGSDFMELCDEAATMQADLITGTEHNLDARKYYVRKKCVDTCMKHCNVGHYKLLMSSTAIAAATTFKPGGTLLLARGNCVAWIIEADDDYMGRWSYVRMRAKAGRVVSIISAYQPCEVRGTCKGKFTIHAQQTSILREQHMADPNPNPRTYFRRDLTKFLRELQAKGDDLILMGDFNGC